MDSNLEIYFSWYLDELKQAGYVRKWTPQPMSYVLFEKATYTWEKSLKTKVKEVELMIPELSQHVYTPDFQIEWKGKARDVFFSEIWYGKKALVDYPFIAKNNVSIIEVKPPKDRYNMLRVFATNQKWMWAKYGIYVQKVVPDELFERTFVPLRYLVCDKKLLQRRNIKYPVKMLNEYVRDETK